MPIERYRPSLTAGQITAIITVFKSTSPSSSVGVSDIQDVLATFVPFQAKIVNGIKSPTSSVETLSEKLGWERVPDFESIRHEAFLKWQSNPQSCTLKELDLAHDYRYAKDLMSAEEKEGYETKLFGIGAQNAT